MFNCLWCCAFFCFTLRYRGRCRRENCTMPSVLLGDILFKFLYFCLASLFLVVHAFAVQKKNILFLINWWLDCDCSRIWFDSWTQKKRWTWFLFLPYFFFLCGFFLSHFTNSLIFVRHSCCCDFFLSSFRCHS